MQCPIPHLQHTSGTRVSDASGFRRHVQGLEVEVLKGVFLESISLVKLSLAPPHPSKELFGIWLPPRSPVLQDLAGPGRLWSLLRTPSGRPQWFRWFCLFLFFFPTNFTCLGVRSVIFSCWHRRDVALGSSAACSLTQAPATSRSSGTPWSLAQWYQNARTEIFLHRQLPGFGQASCQKPFACQISNSLSPSSPLLQPESIPGCLIYAVHKNTWQRSSADIQVSVNNRVPLPN